MSGPEELGVPGLDSPDSNNITDLVGDPLHAGLWVAMNGNQFMVAHELLALWDSVADRPAVFLETLPPGLLADQVITGAIRIGTMTLTRKPDVIAAGPDVLADLTARGAVGAPVDYATNDLAVLARAGVAARLGGSNILDFLGDPAVNVAMPDPRTEGVGRLIVSALRSRGGDELVERVMQRKLAAGTTRLTRIHHRESALWLAEGKVDVAPLWRTEAVHHAGRDRALVNLPIDGTDNQIGRYSIAQVVADGPGQQAARFVQFMRSDAVQDLYARHGFGPPIPA